MENNYLNIKEAAKFLGISDYTLRRWSDSGKIVVHRSGPRAHRRFSRYDLENYLRANSVKLSEKWAGAAKAYFPNELFYCQDSSVFQSRLYGLDKALNDWKGKNAKIEVDTSLLLASIGEVGDNSFGHNIGNWRDISGIFFAYDLDNGIVVLADRGQGVLKTLSRVRPDIKDDAQALRVAFTEIVSGRAPESRGNGLKFVHNQAGRAFKSLSFVSGEAKLYLDKNELSINKSVRIIPGCLAIFRI